MQLTIPDLQLYTYCPRLLKFYRTHKKNTSAWRPSLHTLVEKACVWLFTYLIRTGNYPTPTDLDKMWASHTLDADPVLVNNAWIKVRKVMSGLLQTAVPAYTNLPIRHTYKNTSLIGHAPLICQEHGDTILVLFKAFSSKLYASDLHIRYCAHMLSSVPIKRVAVYNVDPKDDNLTRVNLYTDAFDHDKFMRTLEGLMYSAANGPHHPIYQCRRTHCEFYKECIL